MTMQIPSDDATGPILVIGAGIGGLACAARLARAGRDVTVLERHEAPGGKMRCLPSGAGPVDTGPTVLTMRPVFDQLFADLGERLDDHLDLVRQPCLARHFWPDGSRLDLFDDEDATRDAIAAFAGPRGAAQYHEFSARARDLFEGFEAPMIQAPTPSLPKLVAHVAANRHLVRRMAPLSTLAQLLDTGFDDPRLAQLFGRYATYVGGSPYQVPALLSLIWHVEASGVWVVRGGLHRLAETIAQLARAHGAVFRYGAHVDRIDTDSRGVTGAVLRDGTWLPARTVVFNGDPRALATGAMGQAAARAVPGVARAARSLSAEVWAFAARARGPELAHHNVFFRADPRPEFEALARGERVADPTLYVCAMDRGLPEPSPPLERFEIIANAPPLDGLRAQEEFSRCQTRTFRTLARFGLRFDPEPDQAALTTPSGFDRLFPASTGSLYGQSPHGMMAAFQRPQATTPITGLYLAGGGTHPGAGVPMATLSGRHAAEAILTGRTSTSRSRPTATPGGISTGSRPPAGVP